LGLACPAYDRANGWTRAQLFSLAAICAACALASGNVLPVTRQYRNGMGNPPDRGLPRLAAAAEIAYPVSAALEISPPEEFTMSTSATILPIATHARGRRLPASAGRAAQSARHAASPHAERLASLGLVTASVAHELSSPIAALLSNLGFAAAQLSQASAAGQGPDAAALTAVQGALHDALDAAERVQAISGELRALARAPAERDETLVVGRAVERALSITRGAVLPRAVLERRIAPVPPLRGSEGRLVQVLINLLVNAAQAIPPGQRERHRVTVAVCLRDGLTVAIEVADTGSGIDPALLPRIFDPFFTTKPDGVGLGLAVCRDIVTSLGGELEVESQPGRGTVVRVLVPVAR
jgi:C4-dicarboxylate-specific signal transduction histidine kinase